MHTQLHTKSGGLYIYIFIYQLNLINEKTERQLRCNNIKFWDCINWNKSKISAAIAEQHIDCARHSCELIDLSSRASSQTADTPYAPRTSWALHADRRRNKQTDRRYCEAVDCGEINILRYEDVNASDQQIVDMTVDCGCYHAVIRLSVSVSTVTHAATNRAQRGATSLIKTNALTTTTPSHHSPDIRLTVGQSIVRLS